jgi:hypothetical protein
MMCSTRLICRFPRPGQAVADLVAGRRVDGCGAVPGREVRAAGEPDDVTDLHEQPGRAGRADAVQVHQSAAGGGHQLLEFLVGLLGPPVDPFEVADQLGGHPAAGLADDVAGSRRGQQRLGLRGGQAGLRATRMSSSSS